jgi:hypothetical protein
MVGILSILVIMFAPPVGLIVLGRKAWLNKQKAKKFYIAAVVYLVIGLGTCATILNNLTIH